MATMCDGVKCPDKYTCAKYLDRNQVGSILLSAVIIRTPTGCPAYDPDDEIHPQSRGCGGCGLKIK